MVTAVVVREDALAVDTALLVVKFGYPVELETEELPVVDTELDTVELVEAEVEVLVEELLEVVEVEVMMLELDDEVLALDEVLDVDTVLDVDKELEVDEALDVDETLEVVVGRVGLLQSHSSKYSFMRSAYEVPLIGLSSDSVAS